MFGGHLKVDYDAEKKIWKSINYPYGKLTNRSVGEAFLQSLRCLDSNMVLEYHYDMKREKRVRDVYEESIKVAKNLQRLGMKRADVILQFSGNNYMTSALTFGTILAGGVVNYFEVKLEQENIKKMFETLQPFMILYEEVFSKNIFKALEHQRPNSLKYIFSIDSLNSANVQSELLQCQEDFMDFDNFQPLVITNPQREVAFLVLTSGSTDIPKATQLTHTLLLNGAYIWWENDFQYEPPNSNSILFSLSPLRWISQVSLVLQSSLFGIKRICANKAATGAYGLEIIRQTKPTHIFAVPSFFYDLLLQVPVNDIESFKSLKYIQLGGEPPSSVIINLTLKKAVNSRLFYSYGMSEVASSITNDESRSGGKLQPGFEMQVLDKQLLQQPLGPNRRGQLAIKTPYPFAGYKGRDNSKYFLENGFFLNGDYGYFDDHNTLHFLARVKDLITNNKTTLIPNLVEPLILNLPEVVSVCLVGYNRTPQDSNEVAALFIILKTAASINHNHVATKIREIFMANLSKDEESLIREIYFREYFPLTACGKIDRRALRKIAENIKD